MGPTLLDEAVPRLNSLAGLYLPFPSLWSWKGGAIDFFTFNADLEIVCWGGGKVNEEILECLDPDLTCGVTHRHSGSGGDTFLGWPGFPNLRQGSGGLECSYSCFGVYFWG